jgi:hypothetical protein
MRKKKLLVTHKYFEEYRLLSKKKKKIIKVNFFLRKIVGIGAREFNVCAVNDFFNNIPIFCEFS